MVVARRTKPRGSPERQVAVVLLLALATGGCPRDQPPAPPAASTAAPTAAAPGHDDRAHAHEPPHGGVIESTASGHLELVVAPAGRFKLYVLDENLEARKLSDVSATLVVGVPGYPELHLEPSGDHLEAEGPALDRSRFAVGAVLLATGVQESVRFAIELEAAGRRAAPVKLPPGTDVIVGQIVDFTCIVKGAPPGADHSACALRTLRGGVPVAVLADKTEQVYIAVAGEGKTLQELLVPLLGRRSEVFGQIVRRGGSQFIVVEGAVGEHDHTAYHGGQVGMSGELHLEATAYRGGEVRVYLSDEFRHPLPVAGRRATAEVRGSDGKVETAPLVPAEAGAFLAARFPPLGRTVELTVRMPVPEDPSYFISFTLEPQADPPRPPRP